MSDEEDTKRDIKPLPSSDRGPTLLELGAVLLAALIGITFGWWLSTR